MIITHALKMLRFLLLAKIEEQLLPNKNSPIKATNKDGFTGL